jgi:hypothetical protein
MQLQVLRLQSAFVTADPCDVDVLLSQQFDFGSLYLNVRERRAAYAVAGELAYAWTAAAARRETDRHARSLRLASWPALMVQWCGAAASDSCPVYSVHLLSPKNVQGREVQQTACRTSPRQRRCRGCVEELAA